MKIRIVEYYTTCGDRCCTDWGVRLFVEGEECGQSFADVGDALTYLFRQLGHEVDHEYYEYGFD